MAIIIKEILPNDVALWEKINFNFDQVLLSGGGPIGPTGATGEGLPGERGKRGLSIYSYTTVPQDGTTFIGDIYIGSTGATGFDRGKVYVIGTTGATSGSYTGLNLTGATGSTGATGTVGYSGGIELYAAGLASTYGGVEGIPILSEVNNNNIITGIGATGVNDDEIGFMMPLKQRVGYVFANKYFTSAQNDKFLNLNRHLGTSTGTLENIDTNSTFKNLTPKSIFIQDELNLVTNNGISFGVYNLKPNYEFPADNALQLSGGGLTNPRIGYSTSATSDFIDFVNFGFRLKALTVSSPYKYVTEYLIKSESTPITISAGGIKGSTASRREPTDLTLRANRIVFETYNGQSGYYASSGTFTNNTPYTEANRILFKSPSYFTSSVNMDNDGNALTLTHTSVSLENTTLFEAIDFSNFYSNIAVKAISTNGTAIYATSNNGYALDVVGISRFSNTISGTGLSLTDGIDVSSDITVGQSLIVYDTVSTAYLTTTNNSNIGGNLDIVGTLGVTGAATFRNNVNIATNRILTCGNVNATIGSFSGAMSLDSTLGVTGAATFKSSVTIDGSIGIGTNADNNYKLKISGNSYLDGGISIGTDTLGEYKLNISGDSYFQSAAAITLQIHNLANNKALHISNGRSEFGKVGIGADNTSSDILRVTGTSYFSGATTFNALITLNSGLTVPNGTSITANYAKGNISGASTVSGYVPAVKAFGTFGGDGALVSGTSYNVTSVSRITTGKYLITLNGIDRTKSVIIATAHKDVATTESYNVFVYLDGATSNQFRLDVQDVGSSPSDIGCHFVVMGY